MNYPPSPPPALQNLLTFFFRYSIIGLPIAGFRSLLYQYDFEKDACGQYDNPLLFDLVFIQIHNT